MLTPRKVKYRKQMRGHLRGITSRGYELAFGKYGLKVMQSGWITARQIEAARRAMTRFIRRGGAIWIRIFPDKPVTATPPEVGMGGGKGSVDHYVFATQPGRIIFEIDGVTSELAHEALRLAAFKIPLKTKIVEKK
jgi:large subunit ribosomal protein L16